MFYRAWRGGRRIELTQEIARGGEGMIYQLGDHAQMVAKIYLGIPSREKIAKVSAMLAASSAALTDIAAWPADLLMDAAGRVVGFTMRKIEHAAGVHELYSPRSRATVFPEADLRFMVHVAANITRAFGQLHTAGHVIGDVNHNNLLTSHDGRVNLIDCDSFQIKAGSVTYTCDVGVPLFTAPELQGRGFRGLIRTPQHDLFGLALLIFHLLFMGRHPYAGVWQGNNYVSIEDHIKARRFAYGAQRSKLGVERPPNTVALETFGSDIASLFEQAFGASPGQPKRPSPTAWLDALLALASHLTRCPDVASHYYHDSLAACPWCPLEQATGARLFGRRFEAMGAEMVDVGSLWRAIEGVPPMAAAPPLPSEVPIPTPRLSLFQRLAKPHMRRVLAPVVAILGLLLTASTGSVGVFVTCALLVAALWPWASFATRLTARKQRTDAAAHYEALAQRWNSQASAQPFLDVKESLAKLRYSLDELDRERRRSLAEAVSEPSQRRQYLSRFPLAQAAISLLEEDRKQTLIGVYNIETAADIDPVAMAQVQGLGLAVCDALVQWRAAHEKNFVFDPKGDPSPEEITRIERDVAQRRHDIIKTVQGGPARLEQARKSIEEARRRLRDPLLQAWEALCAAQKQSEM